MRKFKYLKRICDCCGYSKSKHLYKYSETAKTRNFTWKWNITTVICRKCGFAYVSPVPDNINLKEYYADSYNLFQVDYSISKRITLLKNYLTHKSSFLEIGGNNNSSFHKELYPYCKKVYTIEINQSCHAEFNSQEQIKNLKFDVIAAYFVLEHVANPFTFLIDYRECLKTRGFLIIEVPNLDIYPQNPAGIFLYEHLNHFSPRTLAKLANRAGFEVIQISHSLCSRSFGFVAVLQKTKKVFNSYHEEAKNLYEVLHAEYCLKESISALKKLQNEIHEVRKKITTFANTSKPVIIWGANWICHKLFENFKLPDGVILVDKNPEKQNYFYFKKTLLPQDAVDYIKSASLFVINTRMYSNEIINWIRANTERTLTHNDIFILDYF